jgi:hypothetical protein
MVGFAIFARHCGGNLEQIRNCEQHKEIDGRKMEEIRDISDVKWPEEND